MSKFYEKPNNINDYLRTFYTTVFIVFIFVILNIFFMIHNIFNQNINSNRQNIDSAFEAYLVDMLIDKNIDTVQKEPNNYAIDMRLGILYSYKKDYANAEKYFKNAIEKVSVYDYTPTYQLAKLYLKTGKLQDAQALMDNIGEKPNKRLIRFKGDIYSLLGEAYYNQGYYALSAIKYEKAMSYYRILGKKHSVPTNIKHATALSALADKYVETGKTDEAIMALENAYELRPKDILINYKLGLLYADNNPYKALDLFSYVMKKNPQKVNYDMYIDLLQNLSDIESEKDNYTNSKLYQKRIRQYKSFVKNNLLYNKDLFIDVVRSEIKTDIAAKEFILTLQFTLQNNSDLDIDNLTINAIVKDKDKIIQNFNQKVYDDVRIFKAGTVSPPLIVSASEPYKNRRSGSFKIDVYAYKHPKYMVKLYSASIPKPPVEE